MKTNKNQLVSVNWKRYFDINNKTIYGYMNNYGESIYNQMHTRIKNAIKNKLPNVILIKYQNSDLECIIHSSEYKKVLTQMLNICVKMEYYEICAEITKTMQKIQPPLRKRTKVNDTVITI
jgi:hypothetical protein